MKWWPFILLLLLVPVGFRSLSGNALLIDESSYFHLGLVENSLSSSLPLPDLSSSFHFLVALLSHIFPLTILTKLLPLLFGFASAWLFYSITKRDDATILLLISPIFIFIHTTFTPYIFIVFLSLLSWKLKSWWALLPLVALASVNVVGFLGCLILWFTVGRSWKVIVSSLLLVMIGLFSGVIHAGLELTPFISVFASFGFGMGFSLFMIFLCIIGVGTHKLSGKMVIGTIILSLATIIPVIRVLLIPIVALLSAQGLGWLLSRNWSVVRLKKFTFFILALGLMFSTIMILSSQIRAEPSVERGQALEYLSRLDDGVVLSSSGNGLFIESMSGQKAFLDPSSEQVKFFANRALLLTRDEDNSTLLFDTHNISYVFIDPVMLGSVWTHEDEGLLFLLKNSPRFSLVFENEGFLIYKLIDK